MAADIAFSLAILLLVSSVILGLAHLATLALRRRAAALRHMIWVVALGLLLVVPPAILWLPKVEVDATTPAWVPDSVSAALDRSSASSNVSPERESLPERGSNGENTGTAAAGPANGVSGTDAAWSVAASAAYALIGGGLLARLILCLVTLRARLSRLAVVSDAASRSLVDELAALVGVRRAVLLRRDDRQATPWTWGGVRPVIVLPSDFGRWGAAQRRNALAHEMAHVRRLDFVAALLGQLCIALYWFQPLVWSAERARRREAEYSSDDIVVSLGASPPDYANQLLGIARIVRGSVGPGAVASAMAGRPSQFLPRIHRILDPKARRTAMRTSTKLLTVAAGLLLAVPLVLLEPRSAVSQEGVTAADVQRVLVSGPRNETELEAAVEFLIEGGQNDTAQALIVEWLSAPDDAFEGCGFCWRLIDRHDNSPATAGKRAVLMAAFGDVEAAAEAQASPDLLMRLVGVLLHAETMQADDLATYYLVQARAVGELSDYQKLAAVSLLQKVGQDEAALDLARAVHEDPDSPLSEDAGQWMAFIESKMTRMSRMEEQLLRTGSSASATYEYLPAYKQQPGYPAEAAAQRAEGEVLVRYTVTATGRTTDQVVVESTDSVFDQSALESVASYRYFPRVMNGVPVDVPGVQVRIVYRLE